MFSHDVGIATRIDQLRIARFSIQNHRFSATSRGPKPTQILGIRKGGGETYRAILGGGGGKRTIKHPLQSQFWRPQKVGFVWSVPVSSKENDIA